MIVDLDYDNFDNFLDQNEVVLIEGSASWCLPCKAMKPIIQALVDEGHVVGVVDVDKYPQLSHRLGILGVPTFVVFKNGSSTHKVVGVKSKSYLEQILE